MAFGTLHRSCSKPPIRGFNPCFSGMAFGTCTSRIDRPAEVPVSILVFLEWPLGPRRRPWPLRLCCVSILVFLEWPLGRKMKFEGGWSTSSFNPCFSGMAFGTTVERNNTAIIARVSILVFLEWPLGRPDQRHNPSGPLVSILVFLEWPLGQNTTLKVSSTEVVSFNPCFSGMAFGTMARSRAPRSRPCSFNPCFSGMAFGTPAIFPRRR